MTLAHIAIKQLEAYAPFLQTNAESASLYRAFVDWVVKLAIFGILASVFKFRKGTQGGRQGYLETFRAALFYTTHVQSGGALQWVSSYISQDPEVQRQLRDRVITAEEDEGRDSMDTRRMVSRRKPKVQTWHRDGVVAHVGPVPGQELVVMFKSKKLWITQQGSSRSSPSIHASSGDSHKWLISTRYWNRHLVDDFILTAHKLYHRKKVKEIHIYNHSPSSHGWSGPVRRPARAWESVILPAMVKEKLLHDVEGFISADEKAWYASKGIPHRRGYLLHGPPGAGKTTLATALASKLSLNLYCISPAASGMDNSKLERYFQTCPPGSILFIEDIDCVMPVKRSVNESGSKAIGVGTAHTNMNGKNEPGPSNVTLSGLLNAIDGVASQEDSVLFASTNFPDNLDVALRRPGRFDVDVAFDYTTREQAVGIFKHFYSPTVSDSETNATIPPCASSEKFDVGEAAEEFANVLTEANIKVSLATIQGFLLLYKRDPIMAQKDVGEWVKVLQGTQAGSSAVTAHVVV